MTRLDFTRAGRRGGLTGSCGGSNPPQPPRDVPPHEPIRSWIDEVVIPALIIEWNCRVGTISPSPKRHAPSD